MDRGYRGGEDYLDGESNVKGAILRWPQVKQLTGMSRWTIYRWEGEGRFPRRVPLGNHSIGWYEDEVLDWQQSLRASENPLDRAG